MPIPPDTWWYGHSVLLGRYKNMVRWTDTWVLVVTLENPDQGFDFLGKSRWVEIMVALSEVVFEVDNWLES